MIKILILTYYFPPDIGGIENYIYAIINESKFKFFILSPFINNKKSQPSDKNILKIYYYIGFKRLIQQNRHLFKLLYPTILFFQFIGGVYILFRQKQIKAIYSTTGDFIIIPFILSILFNKKLITFLHGNDVKLKNCSFSKLIKGKILGRIVGYSHVICTNSKYTQKIYLQKNTIDSHLFILHPFLNQNTIKNTKYRIPKQKQKYTLITVGRIIRRKGCDNVLKALKILAKQGVQFHYFIVGDGPFKPELCQLTIKLEIEKYITFTGAVKDVSYYYRKADIFIMPSVELNGNVEGFGLVFLEAGIHSLPVIGTWSGGIPDVVIHQKTGLLVDPGDVEEVAVTIQTLINNHKLRKKLSFNGFQHASNIAPNIETIRTIERKIISC